MNQFNEAETPCNERKQLCYLSHSVRCNRWYNNIFIRPRSRAFVYRLKLSNVKIKCDQFIALKWEPVFYIWYQYHHRRSCRLPPRISVPITAATLSSTIVLINRTKYAIKMPITINISLWVEQKNERQNWPLEILHRNTTWNAFLKNSNKKRKGKRKKMRNSRFKCALREEERKIIFA